jgi:hypothetical protein
MTAQPTNDAAVLVFNRTERAIEELIRLSAPIAVMRSLAARWIVEPSYQFLLIISTGGAEPRTATICARDLRHLEEVLTEAAAMIDKGSLPSSVCTPLDLSLGEQLHQRWAEIVKSLSR